MLPDPEHENNPVLGTGGSKTPNELPKHQGMVLFFANERSFFQTIYILWYVESILSSDDILENWSVDIFQNKIANFLVFH